MKNWIVGVLCLVSTSALAENHYSARNCEIFVDRITASAGSHASRTLTFYVKTLNARLDGAISEVGFRNRGSVYYYHGVPQQPAWGNMPLTAFINAQDYFVLHLPAVSSDFGTTTYEGAFYVKTTNGTFYWLKPNHGEKNYELGRGLWDRVSTLSRSPWNYYSDVSRSVATQQDGLSDFNPGRCY